MAFWDDLSRFAGNLTNGLIGESDEERKKKQQVKQQAQAQARAQSVANAPNNTQGPSLAARTNSVNQQSQATKPVSTINNMATRYTKKQRADKGFDFYDGERKIDIDEYTRNTGADRAKLTQEMSDAGDVTSAKKILETVKGGLFRGTENEQRSRAQRVVDTAKKQEEENQKQQLKSLYDNDYQLSGKRIGVKDYIDQYSGADAWRQQRIRDELTREAEKGSQESAILLASIDQSGKSKFDLGQKTFKLGVDVLSGIQRGGATVLDTGIQAAGAIGAIGKDGQDLVKHVDDIEAQRQKLKDMTALDGGALNNKKDFEWTGDPVRDAANLAGRGLDVGLSGTMFANPAALARQGALNTATRQAVGTILRDSTFFGAADAAQGGLSTYGETGFVACDC